MSLFCHCWNSFGISIHALLAESDLSISKTVRRIWHFYPRSPCGERHICLSIRKKRHNNFYPRSPCGERPLFAVLFLRGRYISIHALLAESDASYPPAISKNSNFYPRSPCGERHKLQDGRNSQNIISIHALLAESDTSL